MSQGRDHVDPEAAEIAVRYLPPTTLADLVSACIERPEGERTWIVECTWVEYQPSQPNGGTS